MNLFLVVLLFSTPWSGGGVIRGTVEAPAHDSRSPGAPADRVTDAVVYLESVPPKLERKLAKAPCDSVIVEAHHQFAPRVLAVAAGTSVEFRNEDQIYHNCFSVSPTQKFDIGKCAPNTSRKVRFKRAGEVRLFCEIDPAMSGFVFVVPGHAFVRPDSSGAFTLPKLARGRYRVKVWHPSWGKLSRRVEVPRKGDAVVRLSY